jgi:hypothetical protein
MSEETTAAPGAPPGPAPLGPEDTRRIQERVRSLVRITSRYGKYRSGLTAALLRLEPGEAAIIADLERHGLDVPQLREVLCGAHVLVDDPELYANWRFDGSRERLSSHHKSVDKKQYPDLGLKGPLVREKLHGRTPHGGTWVQLEKTPAAMGHGFRLPSWSDVLHLVDYIVYRITKRNVGPWGLSRHVERRPMYLSPDLGVRMPLPRSAEAELTGALGALERDDDTTSLSPDLARRFPPPDRADTLAELVFRPGERNGRGLFGSSDVVVRETPSPAARAVYGNLPEPPRWVLPPAGQTSPATLRAGDRELATVVRHSTLDTTEDQL